MIKMENTAAFNSSAQNKINYSCACEIINITIIENYQHIYLEKQYLWIQPPGYSSSKCYTYVTHLRVKSFTGETYQGVTTAVANNGTPRITSLVRGTGVLLNRKYSLQLWLWSISTKPASVFFIKLFKGPSNKANPASMPSLIPNRNLSEKILKKPCLRNKLISNPTLKHCC